MFLLTLVRTTTLSSSHNPTEVWSSKSSTSRDQDATNMFLTFHPKLASKFNKKKRQKIVCDWKQQMNWKLLDITSERRKLVLKSADKFFLTYRGCIWITWIMKKTKREPPPFFDQMHDILSQKDKVCKAFLFEGFNEKRWIRIVCQHQDKREYTWNTK